jgi:hypothetical protein
MTDATLVIPAAQYLRMSTELRLVSASPRSPRFDNRTSASARERILDVKAKDARNDVLHWPNPPSSC